MVSEVDLTTSTLAPVVIVSVTISPQPSPPALSTSWPSARYILDPTITVVTITMATAPVITGPAGCSRYPRHRAI
jgi:hypothetical protein